MPTMTGFAVTVTPVQPPLFVIRLFTPVGVAVPPSMVLTTQSVTAPVLLATILPHKLSVAAALSASLTFRQC